MDAANESVKATTYSAGWAIYSGDTKGCSLTLYYNMITPKAIFTVTCNGIEYQYYATYYSFGF